MNTIDAQTERLERLELFVRVTKGLVIVCFVTLLGFFFLVKYVWASTPTEKILHVRGIVIEDSKGIPRLILGAPIPNQSRRRQDEVTGIVLLDSDGIDRLTIGSADYDQVNGKLQHRLASGVGVMLDDTHGNERGGFGILDNGRVTLGLDRASGVEGAFLTVNDEDDFAGLLVKDTHTCNVISFGSSKAAGTRLLLRDRNCADRVVFGIKNESVPELEVRDGQEKLLFDAFSKPH